MGAVKQRLRALAPRGIARAVIAALLVGLAVASLPVLGAHASDESASSVGVGDFVITLSSDSQAVVVAQQKTNATVWASSVSHATGGMLQLTTHLQLKVKQGEGMFIITENNPAVACTSTSTTLDSLSGAKGGAEATLAGTLAFDGSNPCGVPSVLPFTVTWSLAPWSNSSLAARVATADPGGWTCASSTASSTATGSPLGSTAYVNGCAWELHTLSGAAERVHGFGVQYSVWNMKGRVVPILVSEQGIGRGLEPLTTLLNTFSNHQGGNWSTTYGALPYYLTSTMSSFFLNHTEYSIFDLKTSNETISAKLYASSLEFVVSRASEPLALVSEFTKFTGRMQPLPDWCLSGPIIGYYGGTDQVLSLHRNITEKGYFNVTAYWLQDWTGLRDTVFGERLWWNWELDATFYHDWSKFLETLAQSGTKVLTYVNPNFANNLAKHGKNVTHDYFKEGAEKGFLIKNAAGEPYVMSSASPDFTFGKVDLTNPAAMDWMADILVQNMINIGISGWMSDFAEYLPFDSVLSGSAPRNGAAADAAAVHNMYPMLWAKANRIALQRANRSDIVFFSRSSHFHSPQYSTLFWLGDQLVTFDSFDGLQTTLIGRMSSGLAGHSLSHSDIGGYTMVKEFGQTYLRSFELLYRWLDVSAVTDLIFRSHQGNLPEDSAQVYSTDTSLRCLARASRLHTAFVPYRKALMAEAAAFGHPIVRAMWLEYPGIPEVEDELSQVLIGSDVLFAPALDAGQTNRTVVLPEGEWVDVWTRQAYHVKDATSKTKTITIQTPLGEPGIFFKTTSQWLNGFLAHLPSIQEYKCNLT